MVWDGVEGSCREWCGMGWRYHVENGVEVSCREWCGMGWRYHVENGVGWGGGIM